MNENEIPEEYQAWIREAKEILGVDLKVTEYTPSDKHMFTQYHKLLVKMGTWEARIDVVEQGGKRMKNSIYFYNPFPTFCSRFASDTLSRDVSTGRPLPSFVDALCDSIRQTKNPFPFGKPMPPIPPTEP